ncbi:MAG TPA: hypothetical protein ENJ09_06240 [Planctomycetes bacterium]|nr:hypothetical protein [Planctomycetota bacterium]
MKSKTREALERIRAWTKAPPETAAKIGDRNRVVLEPTRESFLRMASLAGLLDPSSRANLWSPAVLKQTAAWTGWTQIVSLVAPAYPFETRNAFNQTSLSKDERTGLAQHVADRCSVHMLRKFFFRHGTHFFEEALGADLVIAAVGRNDLRQGDWKIEYRTAGGRTEPYTRFVPGGNPAGGVLPARKAHAGPRVGSAVQLSRYRVDGGVDFFVKALQAGQKAGAKLAAKNHDDPLRKNKVAHFELHSFDPVGDTYVTAPFLGAAAENKTLPPNDYLDDYEDFFRAYRAAFFEWLRLHGADTEEESAALFAELVRRHAARKVGTPMYEVVQEVYGVPMSSSAPEADSLEWRFLKWLK